MKIPLAKYLWFDGKYVTKEKALVPITTHAIHYGTSVFEGIRAYWNGENLCIFRLEDHINRFRKSGEYYQIKLEYSDDELSNAIVGLLKKNKIRETCYIRPFYFVGQYGISLNVTLDAPTHTAVYVFPFKDLFDKNGITAKVVSWKKFSDQSTPTQAKVGGNYLNSIIATQEAKKSGYDEAILLDHRGNLSEAPGENIFLVRNNVIITPGLSSSALDGITRDTVIKITKENGMRVEERDISRSELFISHEIFLTGTAAEITPVISIDGKKIGDGKTGEITKIIMKEYLEIVENKNEKYSSWITEVY